MVQNTKGFSVIYFSEFLSEVIDIINDGTAIDKVNDIKSKFDFTKKLKLSAEIILPTRMLL